MHLRSDSGSHRNWRQHPLDWMSTEARRKARKLANKVMEPYVAETVGRVLTEQSTGLLPEAFTGLGGALHEARTLALADMPEGATTVLSAGPNARWYFDWFEGAYGRVPRHIGVEAYAPKPPSLPSEIEWIGADIASPEGVASVDTGTVDLVYSGQNVEHLWPEQVEAFLIESHRVLSEDGWLVMDSPNREFTAHFRWSMGEHTIEYTPDEARILLGLAGFEVVSMKGLWLCRRGGQTLELGPKATVDGAGEVLSRIALATIRPHDSFIWWAESRKTGAPDIPALRAHIRKIFTANWEERVSRMNCVEGEKIQLEDGRSAVLVSKDTKGEAMIGPFMSLRPGEYSFGMTAIWSDLTQYGEWISRMEIRDEHSVIASAELMPNTSAGEERVECHATIDNLTFGVHARVFSSGRATLRVPLSLTLSPDPYGLAVTPT